MPIEARHPWRGISPIKSAGTTRKLLENLEVRLAQETGAAVGSMIPVPSVQASGGLQTDIRGMKGQVTLVDTVATGWGVGDTGAPTSDYKIVRLGADPPEVLAILRRDAQASMSWRACGVPQSALSGGRRLPGPVSHSGNSYTWSFSSGRLRDCRADRLPIRRRRHRLQLRPSNGQ